MPGTIAAGRHHRTGRGGLRRDRAARRPLRPAGHAAAFRYPPTAASPATDGLDLKVEARTPGLDTGEAILTRLLGAEPTISAHRQRQPGRHDRDRRPCRRRRPGLALRRCLARRERHRRVVERADRRPWCIGRRHHRRRGPHRQGHGCARRAEHRRDGHRRRGHAARPDRSPTRRSASKARRPMAAGRAR